ncbi:MAG: iron-containing redox enzyme family protein [Solirubrobacterales bacterium]
MSAVEPARRPAEPPAARPAGRPGGRLQRLPEPVGPLTGTLFAALRGDPAEGFEAAPTPATRDPLTDLDLQLALYCCYELHYASFEEVDERWEWSPSLLAFRATLEAPFEAAVAAVTPANEPGELANVGASLQRIVAEDDGPPLSRQLETNGSREQMLEHVVHRSAYQLKEADPHSWAIPRLSPGPKAALLEVQFDEYGGGRAERMHAVLFAATMRALGLDDRYGAYLELLPAPTLATVNLLSGFGLQRRRRGALVGHLAAFEMTSSIPNRRYGNALRRLGCGVEATGFYDEHVEADAVHEAIAAWDLAGGLARDEPEQAGEILFGARALLAIEARWAEHLLSCWSEGRTSLRRPLDGD